MGYPGLPLRYSQLVIKPKLSYPKLTLLLGLPPGLQLKKRIGLLKQIKHRVPQNKVVIMLRRSLIAKLGMALPCI